VSQVSTTFSVAWVAEIVQQPRLFKNRAPVNARSVMNYSVIAEKLTDGYCVDAACWKRRASLSRTHLRVATDPCHAPLALQSTCAWHAKPVYKPADFGNGIKKIPSLHFSLKFSYLVRMHPTLYLIGHKRWYGTEQTPARFTDTVNQNSMQEEVTSRLKLGNACYYSVQNLLSSRLLSKNLD
jgi:hypothetical protein